MHMGSIPPGHNTMPICLEVYTQTIYYLCFQGGTRHFQKGWGTPYCKLFGDASIGGNFRLPLSQSTPAFRKGEI